MKRLLVIFSIREKTFVNVPDDFDPGKVEEVLPLIDEQVLKLYPHFSSIHTILDGETGNMVYED